MSVSPLPAVSDGSAVAVTVTVAAAPAASVPIGQTSGEPEQPVAVAPRMPAPGVSVRVTPAAADGPLFVTVRV